MKENYRGLSKKVLTFALAFMIVFSLCVPVVAQATTDTVPNAALEQEYRWADSGYIRNEYIEAYITNSGHYTMGTVAGDPNSDTDNNKKLLYGHPGSETTNTMVRIDGDDFWFDDYVIETVFSADGTEAITTAVIGDVTVKQILTLTANPYTGMEDLVSIRYTYTNASNTAKQVGVRIMLDTMLGNNDGSPFRVNGEDVTKEVEFSGNNVPQYWQSFDSLQNPRVTASGFFYFSEGEKPDKVQFVAWPNIVSAPWGYEVNPYDFVTSDSAVAAYFNPRTVAAGGSYSVVTYYGISGFSDSNTDLDGQLAVRVTAPSALYGSDLLGGYLNNPFDVSVYVSSPGSETLRDVRAVLSLAGAPQLSLVNSQASTVELGDMVQGENATIQWTLLALPQGVTTTAQYFIHFYAGNELIKTMPLSVQLNELNQEDMYRTVTFDLNGGDGVAPVVQQVLIGSWARKPADPTRQGYIFAGWYANKECTGSQWFSVFNFYMGNRISEDITLYAKWVKAQSLDYDRDTYDFENSDVEFFGVIDALFGNMSYELTGDYREILIEDADNTVVELWDEIMARKWEGSCFGMAAVLALVRAGELDVEFFQSDAENLHDLDNPNSNATVFNLVNFYHLMQYIVPQDFDTRVETNNNKAIIDALKESAYPVLVGFENRNNAGTRINGHAVIAYGFTETSTNYVVQIWDPNYKDTPNTLTISKDYTTSTFANHYDTSSQSAFIQYALTVEGGLYNPVNLQDKLVSMGHSSGDGAVSAPTVNAPYGTARELVLLTNYADFAVVGSDGTTAVVENGYVVSGDLNISDADYMNGIGYELDLYFTIFDNGGVEYTIVPVPAVSVVTGEPLTEYKTTLIWHDPVDGFFSGVTADDIGTIIFGIDGTLTTSYDEATRQRIVTVTNDATTEWYSVTIEGESTGMTVVPGSDSTEITSESDTVITVTAADDHNTLVFETVDVEAGEEVALTEDPANPGTGILDGQQQTMGHALIFYSLGGTPIEAQTNIPYGALATRPADPIRDGFVFAGWYTNPACTDGDEWSFATPITADTRIYAKWLTDENYSLTITFKAEGCDDIIIIVRNGASLTPDQIPAVPQKPGYIGEWDISNFSNITADMIVNAIYTQSGDAHNYQATVYGPTCTEGGYTLYSCSHCGDSYQADFTDPLGHDWVKVDEHQDCTSSDYIVYECSRCGDDKIEYSTGTHQMVTIVHAPTCYEVGCTVDVCLICGYYEVYDYTDIVAHQYVFTPELSKSATCTTAGYATYVCVFCGDSYTRELPALEHNFGEWYVVADPTCTELGAERHDCMRCHSFELRDIEALGHSYEAVVTEPNCTEDGFTTYTCSVCGDSYVDDFVDSLGHNHAAVVTDPTCTEDGYTTYICFECNDTYVADYVDALGHSHEVTDSLDPTCTEDGYITYTCPACGDTYTDVVPAFGHSYEGVVTEPTCTEEGFTTYTCSVCGDTYVADYVDALGHSYDAVVTEPTCTEEGFTTYTCSVCGDIYVADYVDALGHSYEAVVTDPTCTEAGYTTYTCSVCGDTYVADYVDALGHSYEAFVTDPTCTEGGYTTYICSACGDTYTDSYVDALGHEMGEWQTVTEATCTENGEEVRYCQSCDYFETRVVEAPGHNYESVVTDPTCTEGGFTTHTCTACGDSFVDSETEALGHEYVDGFCIRCGAEDPNNPSTGNSIMTAALGLMVAAVTGCAILVVKRKEF